MRRHRTPVQRFSESLVCLTRSYNSRVALQQYTSKVPQCLILRSGGIYLCKRQPAGWLAGWLVGWLVDNKSAVCIAADQFPLYFYLFEIIFRTLFCLNGGRDQSETTSFLFDHILQYMH
jgi:hypothetical protein